MRIKAIAIWGMLYHNREVKATYIERILLLMHCYHEHDPHLESLASMEATNSSFIAIN